MTDQDDSVFAPGPAGIAETPERRAAVALDRLRPRLAARFRARAMADPTLGDGIWESFHQRLERHFPALYGHMLALYPGRDDLFFHVERLLVLALDAWLARPAGARTTDARRETDPAWFQHEGMLGAVCYVDLFAGDLDGVRRHIPYLRELGVTLLHLMPLFKTRPGENDGGYAVSDYRQVHAPLGTTADLAALAADLRAAGISLALDFVFNHTADDHPWALSLVDGADPDHEDESAYLTFPDRTLPDAYGQTLREIFPKDRPGSFTFDDRLGRWVWTTFHSYQWDLNYANPAVLVRMAGEMLFLANIGADVLRLDAVAFTWKRLGTTSESLPEAHRLVRAYNALARIATPGLLFLSEAIVHPDEVVSYIGPEECQLGYNPLQMALGWEALATREVRLLRRSLSHRLALPEGCAWLNYVRSHDDIGWTFDDGDAATVGIDGFDHRRFLNAFYTGRFPGGFARGEPFQANPRTGDARVTGTTASLAGLEKALAEEGPVEVELAIGRIALLYGLAIALPGIPLLYLGDEIATLNDYGYRDDPAKASDSRWVNRPVMWWAKADRRHDPGTVEGRVHGRLMHLLATRRRLPALAGNAATVLDLGTDRVFGFVRPASGSPEPSAGAVIVLANMTDFPRPVAWDRVGLPAGSPVVDHLAPHAPFVTEGDGATLEPYGMVWLGEGRGADLVAAGGDQREG